MTLRAAPTHSSDANASWSREGRSHSLHRGEWLCAHGASLKYARRDDMPLRSIERGHGMVEILQILLQGTLPSYSPNEQAATLPVLVFKLLPASNDLGKNVAMRHSSSEKLGPFCFAHWVGKNTAANSLAVTGCRLKSMSAVNEVLIVSARRASST